MTAAQQYIAVSRRPLDLEDYINVARRHSGWIAGPTFAGLVISVVIALAWPNTWEATAVMQITPSRVSENLVPSVVNQRLTERIEQMRTNIESRQSLANIINDPRLNLYKEEKVKDNMEDIEDEMRRNIHIGLRPESVSRSGGSVFTITFQYRTKRGAMETVNTLISRFMQESKSSENQEQTTVSGYFDDALAQAKAGLEKQNELLTKFRRDHEGRLPEQEQMNMASLSSLQTQVAGIDQELNRLSNEHLTYQTQLNYLENEVKLNESFAQDAADMAGAASGAMARQNDDLLATNKSIETEEVKLQELKKSFRADYPEIRSLESHLKFMQDHRDKLIADQTKQLADETAKPKPVVKKATNFALLEGRNKIQGEIDASKTLLHINESNSDHLRQDREKRNKEIENYRSRLAETSLTRSSVSGSAARLQKCRREVREIRERQRSYHPEPAVDIAGRYRGP